MIQSISQMMAQKPTDERPATARNVAIHNLFNPRNPHRFGDGWHPLFDIGDTEMLLKTLFLPLALLASSCTPADMIGSAGTAPAPLQKTVIDEKGLLAAWSAFDVALTAVDGLVAVKIIVPGSPKALAIKGYLSAAQDGLNAATAAQKAGSTSDYLAALTEAQKALKLASAALKGISV